jgi:hypothetical protein
MNRIDLTHPDAPELAPFGLLPVGVTTLGLAHADQIDIAAASEIQIRIGGMDVPEQA